MAGGEEKTVEKVEKCPKFDGKKDEYMEWKGKVEDWVWSMKDVVRYPGITIRNALSGEPWMLVKDLKREDIAKSEGWKDLVRILDKKYGIDEKKEKIRNMNDLFRIMRGKGENMKDYVSRFDALLRKSIASGMKALDEEQTGGLLLVRSNLEEQDEKIITGRLDGEIKYKRVSEVLIDIMGEGIDGTVKKPERAWLAEEMTKRTLKCYGCNKEGHFKYNCPEKRETITCSGCKGKGHSQPLCRFKDRICATCGKRGHLKYHCDRFEEKEKNEVVLLGEVELESEDGETGDICGIIDTGCPNTVVGEI